MSVVQKMKFNVIALSVILLALQSCSCSEEDLEEGSADIGRSIVPIMSQIEEERLGRCVAALRFNNDSVVIDPQWKYANYLISPICGERITRLVDSLKYPDYVSRVDDVSLVKLSSLLISPSEEGVVRICGDEWLSEYNVVGCSYAFLSNDVVPLFCQSVTASSIVELSCSYEHGSSKGGRGLDGCRLVDFSTDTILLDLEPKWCLVQGVGVYKAIIRDARPLKVMLSLVNSDSVDAEIIEQYLGENEMKVFHVY